MTLCTDARLFQQKAISLIAMWHDVFPEFDSVSEKRTVPIHYQLLTDQNFVRETYQ
jgi:hypothetical protein